MKRMSGRQRKAEMKRLIMENGYSSQGSILQDPYERHSPAKLERLRKERFEEAQQALGSAAGDGGNDYYSDYTNYQRDSGGRPLKPNNRKNRSSNRKKGSRDSEGNSRTERLKEGCSPLEWHSYHYPNCNEIHEIDMRVVVRSVVSRGSSTQRGSNTTDVDHSFPWGFVSNGLWRDVFSCDPREETTFESDSQQSPMPPAVLKIMKSEHPYDQRNFQRHRRDALVMELLSSSHHLVPIYGYCANTVLTQAISHTLDDVIYAREKEQVKLWSPRGGYQTKPPLESWMAKDEKGELLATRETEIGRIQLALGVFRGLMDLHEGVGAKNRNGTGPVEWLPIVHADLQAKQYLVDSQTGHVYLNDFNRCRFISKKDIEIDTSNNTKQLANDGDDANAVESCPLYIPTAPGSSRAPEEYDMAPLSEKLDVYSAGNVLYGIITGNRPWNDERGKSVKTAIQRGERPQVNETIRNTHGTVDAELVRLLDRVYEADPIKRASAKQVVEELEALLEKQLQK